MQSSLQLQSRSTSSCVSHVCLERKLVIEAEVVSVVSFLKKSANGNDKMGKQDAEKMFGNKMIMSSHLIVDPTEVLSSSHTSDDLSVSSPAVFIFFSVT